MRSCVGLICVFEVVRVCVSNESKVVMTGAAHAGIKLGVAFLCLYVLFQCLNRNLRFVRLI